MTARFWILFVSIALRTSVASNFIAYSSQEIPTPTPEFFSVQFSLWYPDYEAGDATGSEENSMAFVDPVLNAIQEFLCEETDFVVLDDSQGNSDVCGRLQPEQQQSVIQQDLFVVSDIQLSYIAWTTWTITYEVLQSNPDHIFEMSDGETTLKGVQAIQYTLQDALDESIRSGSMDERLQELGARLSPVGEEVEFFVDDIIGEEEEENDEGRIRDPSFSPEFLRWIGSIMLAASVVFPFMLTLLSGRQRNNVNQDRNRRREELGGLVTEAGVDQMLEIGRRESTKALSAEFRSNPSSELFTLNSSRSRSLRASSGRIIVQDLGRNVAPRSNSNSRKESSSSSGLITGA